MGRATDKEEGLREEEEGAKVKVRVREESAGLSEKEVGTK